MKKTITWIMAILTGLTAFSLGACDNSADLSSSQTEQVEQSSGFEVNAGQESGISLLATTIAESDYEAYGVSEQAESAVEITATVTPENATNVALDWSVAFSDPASEWATGKTVTDYVTVTPTEDGALTAVVECFQEFGEIIALKVTSRENSEIKTSIPCHYRERIAGFSYIAFGNDAATVEAVDGVFYESLTRYLKRFYELSSSAYTTVDGGFRNSIKVYVWCTEEWKAAVEAQGLIIASDVESATYNGITYYGKAVGTYGWFGFDLLTGFTDATVAQEAYETAMQSLGAGKVIGLITIVGNSFYNQAHKEFDLVLGDEFYVAVEDVSFTDSDITF